VCAVDQNTFDVGCSGRAGVESGIAPDFSGRPVHALVLIGRAVVERLVQTPDTDRDADVLSVAGGAADSAGALELEYGAIRECVPLRVCGAERLDDLHQVIEHFEWASGVCRRFANATSARQRVKVIQAHSESPPAAPRDRTTGNTRVPPPASGYRDWRGSRSEYLPGPASGADCLPVPAT
jgi:hypothetical protein